MSQTLPTLGETYRHARALLERCTDSPERDARLLANHAFDLQDKDYILAEHDPADISGIATLNQLLERRMRGEPVARILGYRDFWQHRFALNEATLIPRPETEHLVEAALAALPDQNAVLDFLDLGTGSGCILISLLAECPNAHGIGTDLSPLALDMARQNARDIGVANRSGWAQGNWFGALENSPEQRFDIIVSNPPYIADNDPDLSAGVRAFEPAQALFAPDNGLADYTAIAGDALRHLKNDGHLIVEIGHTQADAVKQIFTAAGFTDLTCQQDLAGKDRVIIAARSPKAR